MKILADYHTHTLYSCGQLLRLKHAKGTIEENVKSAIDKGLETIGISEHGYFHFVYGLRRREIPKIRAEINRLNEKYPQINILLGCECNIIDNTGRIDMDEESLKYMDYINAGYHFGTRPRGLKGIFVMLDNAITGGKHSIKYNTQAVVNAMRRYDIFYITHPGDKGMVDIEEVARVAVETDTGLEINGGHGKLSAEDLEKIKDMDVKLYIGSDAHRPERVGCFEKALAIIDKTGIDRNKIKNVRF